MPAASDHALASTRRLKARVAGISYVLCIVFGLWGAFIAHSQPTLSATASVLGDAFYIVVTVVLYDLFKPVNQAVSLVAALFSLTGCALSFVDSFHLAVLPFQPIVFFGPYCLLLGYMILSSTVMRRIVGVLLLVTGVGWLTFLSHTLAHHIARYVMGIGLLGEGSLTLSLLFGRFDEDPQT